MFAALLLLPLQSQKSCYFSCEECLYVTLADCCSTLDTLEKFPVSPSSFDHVSSLVTSHNDDVWVTVKGSTKVQLYDAEFLTCRLNYDVSTNKPAELQKVTTPK